MKICLYEWFVVSLLQDFSINLLSCFRNLSTASNHKRSKACDLSKKSSFSLLVVSPCCLFLGYPSYSSLCLRRLKVRVKNGFSALEKGYCPYLLKVLIITNNLPGYILDYLFGYSTSNAIYLS